MSILSATQVDAVKNYIGGEWKTSQSAEFLNVVNPATQKVLAAVPVSDAAEVNAAIAAASKAFPAWRATPPEDRIQYLFKLKQLLEEHFDEIARITTTENGKTLAEARAELRRGIENVEVACGIPTLMQGYNLEDVARGIDEIMIRQPLGSGGRNHALQFSGDDSVLVSAVCDCLREYVHPEAVGKSAAHHAARV